VETSAPERKQEQYGGHGKAAAGKPPDRVEAVPASEEGGHGRKLDGEEAQRFDVVAVASRELLGQLVARQVDRETRGVGVLGDMAVSVGGIRWHSPDSTEAAPVRCSGPHNHHKFVGEDQER